MSTAFDDLSRFNQFAVERLSKCEIPLDELMMEWYDSQSPEDIQAAIQKGLDDVDAGRYQPAEVAMESVRKEFGFPQR